MNNRKEAIQDLISDLNIEIDNLKQFRKKDFLVDSLNLFNIKIIDSINNLIKYKKLSVKKLKIKLKDVKK